MASSAMVAMLARPFAVVVVVRAKDKRRNGRAQAEPPASPPSQTTRGLALRPLQNNRIANDIA